MRVETGANNTMAVYYERKYNEACEIIKKYERRMYQLDATIYKLKNRIEKLEEEE